MSLKVFKVFKVAKVFKVSRSPQSFPSLHGPISRESIDETVQTPPTHNLLPVPLSMLRLMDPIPSTQTPSRRTSRHTLRNRVFGQPRPNGRVVHANNGQIGRLQSIDVGGVRDGEGCTAEILWIGGFAKDIVDV